jgi:hypothetical protein
MVFGDEVFKELIKVKWDHMREAESDMTGVLIRKGRDPRDAMQG